LKNYLNGVVEENSRLRARNNQLERENKRISKMIENGVQPGASPGVQVGEKNRDNVQVVKPTEVCITSTAIH
jgi:cell division protein FtsB